MTDTMRHARLLSLIEHVVLWLVIAKLLQTFGALDAMQAVSLWAGMTAGSIMRVGRQ